MYGNMLPKAVNNTLCSEVIFLLVTFLRTFILYLVVVFGLRLMGKRQIGELQPSELVITILISNIATLTIEETDSPMFAGLLPILALMCFEVLTSFFCLKSARLRRIVSGRPIIIIHNGKIDQKEMRELRFSADDLMTQLRQNGIFRVEEVEFAVVETNGKLSVYQKYQSRTVTPQALSLPDRPDDNAPPLAVVCEGTIMNEALRRSGRDLNWVKKQAAARKLPVEEVYLMVACPDGSCDIIAKERDR